MYDLIYGSKDYAAEAEQIRAVLDQHAGYPVDSLLDVACGTGRHLEQLAAHFSVEGLDLESRMLDLAKARLPNVPFHLGNMCAFDLGKQYDAVICLFGSIGYARTLKSLRANRAVDGSPPAAWWIIAGGALSNARELQAEHAFRDLC